MSKGAAFLAGWATANVVEQLVIKLAWSESSVGEEVRRRVIGRLDHDRLLRLEEEVQEEIIRRTKNRRQPLSI